MYSYGLYLFLCCVGSRDLGFRFHNHIHHTSETSRHTTYIFIIFSYLGSWCTSRTWTGAWSVDGVEAESPESRSDVVDVVGEVAARGEGGGGGAVALAVDVVPARAEELVGRDVLAGLARPVEGALGPPAWGRAEGRRVSRDGLGMGGDGGEGGGWVGVHLRCRAWR